MKTAVVILNWNGQKLLEQFLPSVIKYSEDAAIYVVDNFSSDTSVAYLKTNFPTVKCIVNKANYGFAKGYNEGLKHIEADILILLNSDVEVTENWLAPLLTTFDSEPNTAVIQPKILDFKNKTLFEYAGAAGGFIDKFGFPFCRGRLFETIEADHGQYNDVKEIFWASGACFAVRKKVFEKLDGFDVNFFAHQGEIDFCWRAKNKGYQIKYNGLSTIYHLGGATLQHGSPLKVYLNFRNSLFMLIKNLPTAKLFPVLFIRLFLDGLAGIKFLSEGKFQCLIAILKSHVAFYFYFFKMFGKRESNQINEYYTVRSIVWNYFIRNKKSLKI